MSLGLRRFEAKAKISALWILMGFSMTIAFTLMDFDPSSNGLAHMLTIMSPQQLPPILLGDAAIRLAPFVFAFLSLALKDTWNRRGNLALGLVFTIFSFFGVATLILSQTFISAPYALLIQVATIAAPVLISWYAYRWPREGSDL